MSSFRHRHLQHISQFFGTITKMAFLPGMYFNIIAENYTKLQRRGKLEKEVYERWKSILERWWNEPTEHADFNKDRIVEFDEWLKFFTNLGKSTKNAQELPDLPCRNTSTFCFLIMDFEQGWTRVRKRTIRNTSKRHNMDTTRADE
uniref:Putative conserved plasma membrane protein n=1 Tax=Ixodes ricinus TaxID=34613 RepID=A0A090XBH7_IXORI